jgi:hypothetical protein
VIGFRPGLESGDDPGRRPGEKLSHSQPIALDRDDFGLKQSKIMTVIDSNSLERNKEWKSGSHFPHPARVVACVLRRPERFVRPLRHPVPHR